MGGGWLGLGSHFQQEAKAQQQQQQQQQHIHRQTDTSLAGGVGFQISTKEDNGWLTTSAGQWLMFVRSKIWNASLYLSHHSYERIVNERFFFVLFDVLRFRWIYGSEIW